MLNLVWVFLAGYASVFLLGFQSRAVNHGNYRLAAANSIFIGTAQGNLWLLVTADKTFASSLVYGISGGFGIVSAMWVHQRFFAPKKEAK